MEKQPFNTHKLVLNENGGEDWPTKMWRWSLKVRKVREKSEIIMKTSIYKVRKGT